MRHRKQKHLHSRLLTAKVILERSLQDCSDENKRRIEKELSTVKAKLGE